MKMSNKSKILALLLCMALVAGGSVLATMAYLMDTDETVNTFTVGKVGITLDEAAVTPDGVPVEGADRVKTNAYHLIPGQTYTKDPMITLDPGSEPSYIRMVVTLNKASALKSALGEDFLPQNYVNGTWDDDIWPCVNIKEDAQADTITYEFRYHELTKKITAATPLAPLFTEFALPGTVSGTQLKAMKDFKITVAGHAIQAAGFVDADAAWTAFDVQYALEHKTVTE